MKELPSAPSWPGQVALLTQKALSDSARNPVLVLNLVLAWLFLLVYDGTVGGLPLFKEIAGNDYLTFLLPAAILAASVGGGAAGLLLVGDLSSGYLQKLLTMPLRRSALVASLLVAAGFQVVIQTVGVICFALLLGAEPHAGPLGYAGLFALCCIWGAGFAAYSIAIAVITADVQMTATANLIFIPLIFFSPLLVPYQYLKPWMQRAADSNPTRYVMEGMRGILEGHSSSLLLVKSAVACCVFFLAMLALALTALRLRLPRRVR
jgi:ABC-2 type transport system permease protein